MLNSVIKEYGLPWVINRGLYSAKLKMMSFMPCTEKLFEKEVKVKNVDIFNFNIDLIKKFLIGLHPEKQKQIIDDGEKLCNVAIEATHVEVIKIYRSLYYLKREEISCVKIKSRIKDKKCKFKIEFKN